MIRRRQHPGEGRIGLIRPQRPIVVLRVPARDLRIEREARATLARLSEPAKARYVSAYDVALMHIALGDRNQGLNEQLCLSIGVRQ